MKTITVRNDSANLELTLNELIIIRNSLIEVLSKVGRELKVRTTFYPEEIRMILESVEKMIKELE